MSHSATQSVISGIPTKGIGSPGGLHWGLGAWVYYWDMTEENGQAESRIMKEDQAAFEKHKIT